MKTLVLVHYARSLDLDDAKIAWGLERVGRAVAPLGADAVLLDATDGFGLSPHLMALALEARLPFIRLRGDGQRYDSATRATRPWLEPGEPRDVDHVRTSVCRQLCTVMKQAQAAGWQTWLVILRDPASVELYTPYLLDLLKRAPVCPGQTFSYPETEDDANPRPSARTES